MQAPNVQPPQELENNMSDQVAVPDHYRVSHCLTFIYLTFSSYTDGEVAAEEVVMIAKKLEEWPFIDDSGGMDLVQDVYKFWSELNSDQTIPIFQDMVAFVKRSLSEDGRAAVLNDLMSIAAADNEVKQGEVDWLKLLKRDLGV